MQCLLSFRVSGSSHKLPHKFLLCCFGCLSPRLGSKSMNYVITFLQTPSVSNETPCQTKVSTGYRPTGQTDYYTLQTSELLPSTWVPLKSSHKNPLARNKNLHALVRANYAVLWEYLMNLWHDDPLPCWTPPSQSHLCESPFKQEKTSPKFKLHGASLQNAFYRRVLRYQHHQRWKDKS